MEGVKIDAGGLDAIVRLGEGDMRRTLNILQSTAMAAEDASVPIVREDAYNNTGAHVRCIGRAEAHTAILLKLAAGP